MDKDTFIVSTKKDGKFEDKEYTISSKQKKLVRTAEAILRDIFDDSTVDPQVTRYNLEGLIEFAEDILGRNGVVAQRNRATVS